ncbi:MAG: polyphosphate kinase 1 [Candidatus Sumerlaeota bacterium]|nr:polyphosphate kinase 1 [Candidatus Sumerlaeota bacterium]
MKLNAPENFINREISWLEFNSRVLEEGLRLENPLLERLKFLAIVSSNLDEFFMVRVGELYEAVRMQQPSLCPSGMTCSRQIEEIAARVHEMTRRQYECLEQDLAPALARKNIVRERMETLDPLAAGTAKRYFEDEVFPVLTPLAAEDEENFPRMAGLTLHVAVCIRPREAAGDPGKTQMALIPIPRSWPRFFQIPAAAGYHYILLEDLVVHCAETFFPGYEIVESAVFRLTRNADLPLEDEETSDLMEAMEDILRERKSGAPLRLEIDARASQPLYSRLAKILGVDPKRDLYLIQGPLDLKPFMGLAPQMQDEELRYAPYDPPMASAFSGDDSLWDVLRKRDVLLHHPYDSFAPVIRLLQEAADDPQVTAIKQTLYRTSSKSPIMAALERAALNGKQVTVLVELKARFDEAQNIAWARRLSEAGALVIYGVLGLKTHSKILMIIRREADGVRRYLHLSTGNYNDITARLYEDMALFTSDPDYGNDASNFFNAITGYSQPRPWRRLVIAPMDMRRRLYELIEREILRASPRNPGRIMLKCNSLLDPDMCAKLYEASQAGVRIRICTRGICCLRPGVAGLSENIEVISIVDRYLEHSRIFYFHNGGEPEIFLSSADWMPRNLDRRVEIMFPILDEELKRKAVHVLETAFSDNSRARRLLPDGSYEPVETAAGEPERRAQFMLMQEAIEQAETARARHLATFMPAGPGVAPGT